MVGALLVLCPVFVNAQGTAKSGPSQTQSAKTGTQSKSSNTGPKFKELITEEEEEKLLNQIKSKYTLILLQGKSDSESIRVIQKWARLKLYSMTRTANRGKLHEIRDEILRRIRSSGQILARANPAAGRRFREIVCKAVAERASELLDNHFAVRLNAILILSQMNVVERDLVKGTLPVAYIPAADILIRKVLKDPTQPQAVLIVAVNAIRRLALLGEPNTAQRRAMANALIPILKNKKYHSWLLSRTAEALGAVGVKTDLSGRASIVQILMQTMVDKSVPPQVRSYAAKALGRTELAPNVDVSVITFEITDLTRQLAERYNAELKTNRVATHWPGTFYNIHLAFYPASKDEVKLYGSRAPGLLSRYKGKAFVEQPYQKIKPVLKYMIFQPVLLNPEEKDKLKRKYRYNPIKGNLITDIATWQSNNRPSATSVQPGLPSYRAAENTVSAKTNGRSPVTAKP
ncbi:MAG: hypothetical protein Tsb009_07070 [Planctomycetaceae bacterium]